jgi:hypothetical protein
VATVGSGMLLRYYADNKGTSAGVGQPVEYPMWWEQAPLIGIVGGAAATLLAYYLWGTEAAIAAGVTAIFSGVSPVADDYVREARATADMEAAKATTTTGSAAQPGLRGADYRALADRLAQMEQNLAQMSKAA